MTGAPSAPAPTAAPTAVCAREGRSVAAEVAPESSQVSPRQRSAASRFRVPAGLARRRAAQLFAVGWSDCALAAAFAPGRGTERWALAAARVRPAQWLLLVVSPGRTSSSHAARSSSRSFAWPPATSQVAERLSQLPAWLHHCKIAKSRLLQHQYKLPPDNDRTLASFAL